jgi:hypothetical protein
MTFPQRILERGCQPKVRGRPAAPLPATLNTSTQRISEEKRYELLSFWRCCYASSVRPRMPRPCYELKFGSDLAQAIFRLPPPSDCRTAHETRMRVRSRDRPWSVRDKGGDVCAPLAAGCHGRLVGVPDFPFGPPPTSRPGRSQRHSSCLGRAGANHFILMQQLLNAATDPGHEGLSFQPTRMRTSRPTGTSVEKRVNQRHLHFI